VKVGGLIISCLAVSIAGGFIPKCGDYVQAADLEQHVESEENLQKARDQLQSERLERVMDAVKTNQEAIKRLTTTLDRWEPGE
jgi:hypothetical protein